MFSHLSEVGTTMRSNVSVERPESSSDCRIGLSVSLGCFFCFIGGKEGTVEFREDGIVVVVVLLLLLPLKPKVLFEIV